MSGSRAKRYEVGSACCGSVSQEHLQPRDPVVLCPRRIVLPHAATPPHDSKPLSAAEAGTRAVRPFRGFRRNSGEVLMRKRGTFLPSAY